MNELRDPVPPGHGEPDRESERPRTYAVEYVFPDGNPDVDSRWGQLAQALRRADELRGELGGGGQFAVGVSDEDDPERGWLSEEDL